MSRRAISCLVILAVFTCLASLSAWVGWRWVQTAPFQPGEKSKLLFQGVAYERETRQTPRPMVIHVVTIDLRQKGLSFLVTPGEAKEKLPLQARTTSQFLQEFELQLAINGDGFTPWQANGPLDYYPHAGDRVKPNGLAASRGVVYAQSTGSVPVLYLARNNKAAFNSPTGKIYNAISGDRMLVEVGRPVARQTGPPEPRTAIGLDKSGRRLILVLVDGRQPGYSEGATLAELAKILIDYGAVTAMNLDGGGSTTLVIQDADGNPKLLNLPIQHRIPGAERPVGNHLGIYAPAIPASKKE